MRPPRLRGKTVRVTISTLDSQSSTLNSQLREDGFAITAKPGAIEIVGANPRGALYGAYEILKRFGGIRWLAPGDDCEYFTLKGDVVVPCGTIVENPRMRVRTNECYGSGADTWKWAARNNRVITVNKDWFYQNGKRTSSCDLLEDTCAASSAPGGHVICELMYGEFKFEKKERVERLNKLFKDHPNWFPLVHGKRITTYANPCLQDPALFDHMVKNYLPQLRGPHAFDLPVVIGNNDTTIWCECEKCKAMDDPKMAGTAGQLANRYWYMVNELAKRIWKEIPDAKLAGWAYQNFWYPPTKVKPDPRLAVLISYNNQCWKHSVADPSCIVNQEMARVYRAWQKMDIAYLWNRAEIACEDAPGAYAPAERTLYNNYREYAKIGCAGDYFCCYGPDWKFMNWAKDTPPYYGHNYRWWAMWQTQWLSSHFMWRADADYEALYEECNRLYYGVAWEGGMRAFRRLLEESFYHGEGCIGWGQHNPLGKCLVWPADSEARLTALLEKAIACAQASGDARALKHILLDREIFRLTWIATYKDFLSMRREFTARERTGEIKIDGVLDEVDWQKAETLGDFRMPIWETADIRAKKVNVQTNVKALWDKSTLYFAIEALDPEMDNVRSAPPEKVNRNTGWSELGDHVELFYQTPQMGPKAFQLCINSDGGLVDGIKKSATVFDGSFDTSAKYAVKKQADRWILEIAIPAAEIGGFPSVGETWRMNACRSRSRLRKATKVDEKGELLTSANGNFYAPSSFVYMNFIR